MESVFDSSSSSYEDVEGQLIPTSDDLLFSSSSSSPEKSATTQRSSWRLPLLILGCLALITLGLLLVLLPASKDPNNHSEKQQEKAPEKEPLRPPFTITLCNSSSCWPEGTIPTFHGFHPDGLPEGLPRNNRYRYTGTDTWLSKGIDLERAVRMMLGDRTLVFESFLFQTVRAFVSGKALPNPYSWNVDRTFTDSDGEKRTTAVDQGVVDAKALAQLFWKYLGSPKQFIKEDESTEVVKQLLTLFDTKQRLLEFVSSLNARPSDQPIDILYSSVYNNLAEQYGDELVVMKPETEPYRSLDINVWSTFVDGQHPADSRNMGQFATPAWIESDQIAGYQFYEESRKEPRVLRFSFNLIEDSELSSPLVAIFDGSRADGSESFGIERLPDGNFVYLSPTWKYERSHYPETLVPFKPFEYARPIGFLCVSDSGTSKKCEHSLPPAILTKYASSGSSAFCSSSKSETLSRNRTQLEELLKTLKSLKLNGVSRYIHYESLCN